MLPCIDAARTRSSPDGHTVKALGVTFTQEQVIVAMASAGELGLAQQHAMQVSALLRFSISHPLVWHVGVVKGLSVHCKFLLLWPCAQLCGEVSYAHIMAETIITKGQNLHTAFLCVLRLTPDQIVRPQAGFDHLDEVLRLDHAAMAEAAALRARTYLQLALPADRVHFIDSEVGLDRRD